MKNFLALDNSGRFFSGTQDHTNGTLYYDSLGQLGKKIPFNLSYKIKLPREKYTAQIFGERCSQSHLPVVYYGFHNCDRIVFQVVINLDRTNSVIFIGRLVHSLLIVPEEE